MKSSVDSILQFILCHVITFLLLLLSLSSWLGSSSLGSYSQYFCHHHYDHIVSRPIIMIILLLSLSSYCYYHYHYDHITSITIVTMNIITISHSPIHTHQNQSAATFPESNSPSRGKSDRRMRTPPIDGDWRKLVNKKRSKTGDWMWFTHAQDGGKKIAWTVAWNKLLNELWFMVDITN